MHRVVRSNVETCYEEYRSDRKTLMSVRRADAKVKKEQCYLNQCEKCSTFAVA